MRIFLSWSGERSRALAESLREWLPDVIAYFEPWLSSEDIQVGAMWSLDLANQLEKTHVGIICVTPENMTAPWVLFEAGALAKAMERSRVCTYLLGMTPGQLEGPLVQFQATQADRADTLKLVQTLNALLGPEARPRDQVDRLFKQWWPEMERRIAAVRSKSARTPPRRADRDILEELLTIARQQMRMRPPDQTYPSELWCGNLLPRDTVLNFFRQVNVREDANDSVADDWVVPSRLQKETATLEGVWNSRWNEDSVPDRWMTGLATVMSHGPYWVLLHRDSTSEYLMIGWQDGPLLLGYHYNLSDVRDQSPWVGRLISPDRIDGAWKGGRWDLRR